MLKKLSFFISVFVLSLVVGVFIFAWTEPTSVPPGENVPSPINVGDTAQSKIGRLQLGNSATSWLNDSITGFTEPVVSNDGFLFVGGYTGTEDSDLRLYMLDNGAERFSIWGDSCGGGNCDDLNAATLKHYFTAGGGAWHLGDLTIGSNLAVSGTGSFGGGVDLNGRYIRNGYVGRSNCYWTGCESESPCRCANGYYVAGWQDEYRYQEPGADEESIYVNPQIYCLAFEREIFRGKEFGFLRVIA